MQRFTSTKLFRVIVIAALLVLLVFINPRQLFGPVRNFAISMLVPFQKISYSLSLGLEDAGEFLGSIGQLKRENENLVREKQNLLAENALLHDLEKENSFLREQLDILPRDRFEFIASSVMSQDPNGMGNWIAIDKGREDGISEGMAVIVSKGILVGKVQEVGAHNSRVVLLTNPKSTISAATVGSGAKGVAKGEYGLGIILDMILQTDSVQVGDAVVTSGIGGEMPRGLYVGTIQEVHPSDDHLFQQAVVTSPLQVSKLQVVFVIRGEK